MNVSFTGFKNASACYVMQHPIKTLDDGTEVPIKDTQVYVQTVNTQLVDDFNGKDLSTYKNALAHSDISGYYHPINRDMVNIQSVKVDSGKGQTFYLLVNGKIVDINDKNLKLISFVSNLMKKISAEKSKNFVVNQDFINGDEPSFATNLGMDMFELFDYNHEKYRDFILAVYKPKNVKAFAKQVFASVQDRMEEYFK